MKFTTEFRSLLEASDFITRLKLQKTINMDNTEFTNWNPCLVKGIYFGGLRKVSATGATPLLFGQAVHTGLAALLRDMPLNEALELADLDAQKSRLDSFLDPKRNRSSLQQILVSYEAHTRIMANEKLVPVELNGTKVVEQNFCVPLGVIHFKAGELFPEACDIQVNWTGVMDVLCYLGTELWIVDHKTTSIMGEKFVDDKVRSSQMLGYTHIARLLAEQLGKPVVGVLINALAHRSSGFEFQQFKIPMADWKIKEWHSETLLAVSNIVKAIMDFLITGEVAPNRESCVTKYGKCAYFSVCDTVPPMRDRLLADDSFFVDNLWNPNAA